MHGARPATTADLDDLVLLAAAAREEMIPERGGRLWSLTLGRSDPLAAGLADQLVDPRARVLCGTVDDVTVGYAVAHLEQVADGSTLAVVDDLYTAPDGRRVGVGEAMMTSLVEWATEHGAIGIDAVALPGMRDTKNFFESFGLVARAIVVHRSLP